MGSKVPSRRNFSRSFYRWQNNFFFYKNRFITRLSYTIEKYIPGVLITPPHLVTRAELNDSDHLKICSSTSRLFIWSIWRLLLLCSTIRAMRANSREWERDCSWRSFSSVSTRSLRSITEEKCQVNDFLDLLKLAWELSKLRKIWWIFCRWNRLIQFSTISFLLTFTLLRSLSLKFCI